MNYDIYRQNAPKSFFLEVFSETNSLTTTSTSTVQWLWFE